MFIGFRSSYSDNISLLRNIESIGLFFKRIAEASIFIARAFLIWKIYNSKSVSGLSLKTNIIYLVVYLIRYYPYFEGRKLLFSFVRILFIVTQAVIIYLISKKYRKSYYQRQDNFPISVLFVTSLLCAFFFTQNSVFGSYYNELFQNTALILESMSILPQLVMLQEAGDCEIINSLFIFFLGLYRVFYLIFFLCFAFAYPYNNFQLFIITSIVQNILYIDFFLVIYRFVFLDKDYGVNLETLGNSENSYRTYNQSKSSSMFSKRYSLF